MRCHRFEIPELDTKPGIYMWLLLIRYYGLKSLSKYTETPPLLDSGQRFVLPTDQLYAKLPHRQQETTPTVYVQYSRVLLYTSITGILKNASLISALVS